MRFRERNEVMLHVANDLTVLAKLFAVLAARSSDVGTWRLYRDHQHAAVLLVTERGCRIVKVLQASPGLNARRTKWWLWKRSIAPCPPSV